LLQSVYQRYDRNRNGVFEKEEWSGFRTDPSSADRNRDGKITRDEISAYLQERYLGGGGSRDSRRSEWFGRRDSNDENNGRDESSGSRSGSDERRSYRIATATERLPDGLPDWYARSDADGDGQVMMSEYAASWNQSVADDFSQFDLNNDGIITPMECLEAVDRGAVQGMAPSSSSTAASSSFSYRSRRRESPRPEARQEEAPRVEEPAASASTTTSDSPSDGGTTPAAQPAAPTGKLDSRYVKYAVGLIKRYDQNSDGVLTKDEWTKMSNDYSGADTDGDGRITPTELAAEMMKQ
jgi:Ca2+-binding EF-hand superfamily protein